MSINSIGIDNNTIYIGKRWFSKMGNISPNLNTPLLCSWFMTVILIYNNNRVIIGYLHLELLIR